MKFHVPKLALGEIFDRQESVIITNIPQNANCRLRQTRGGIFQEKTCMLKVLKTLSWKEWGFAAVCVGFIVLQIWMDLIMPDYMSKITQLSKEELVFLYNTLRQKY